MDNSNNEKIYNNEENGRNELIKMEFMVNNTLGKIYKNCGQKLLDLSEKNRIETKEEMKIALIAIKGLASYFSITSEIDNVVFNDNKLFNYDSHLLPCGKKVSECNVFSGKVCKYKGSCEKNDDIEVESDLV